MGFDTRGGPSATFFWVSTAGLPTKGGGDMKRRTFLTIFTVLISLTATSTKADDDNAKGLSVTVAFGAGLNTLPPGNPANHHVIPRQIRIKTGGVVNFVVAGFHQVFVYLPGRTPDDIV